MDRDELMTLAAEKAYAECDWASIEFLFRPSNGLELMLRIDFDDMRQRVTDWCVDDSPPAMPHRFRPPYARQMHRIIEVEEFYRKLKGIHDQVDNCLCSGLE